MEAIWEPDEFEKRREKSKMTINTFAPPMTNTARGGGGGGSRGQQGGIYLPQDPPPKTVSISDRFNKVFSANTNTQFGNDSDDEQEDDDDDDDDTRRLELDLFSGMETRDPDDEEEDVEEQETGASLKRRCTQQKKPPRPKRVKYDRATRGECFLCSRGDKQYDDLEAPHVAKLIDIIKKNHGYYENIDIANNLVHWYNKEIYQVYPDMPVLTPEMVVDHIETRHSLDAGMNLIEMVRQENKLYYLLSNSICLEDGGYDYKAIVEYRKSQKFILDLYKTDPTTLAFSNGNDADDMKRIANCVGLLPRITQGRTTTKKNGLAPRRPVVF